MQGRYFHSTIERQLEELDVATGFQSYSFGEAIEDVLTTHSASTKTLFERDALHVVF
jgi:hypothetical protein